MLVFIKAFTYSFSALNQVGPGVDPASKVGGEISALFGSQQRWDRIRVTWVDSGRILRFSFGPGSV